MQCLIHEDQAAVDRCCACAELFCASCLVDVSGAKYCDSCKCLVVENTRAFTEGMSMDENVMKATGCAIASSTIGLLVCIVGVPCAIAAIVTGFKALDAVKQNPRSTGWGLAVASIIIGFVTMGLHIVGLIAMGAN